jgi:GNAT superfamily N-acetyltransferase
MSTHLRRATSEDFASIRRIEDEVSDETGMDAYSDSIIRGFTAFTDVIVVGGDVIGFCTHHVLTKSVIARLKRMKFYVSGRCAKTHMITNIAVDKQHRSKGYGTMLVRKAVSRSSTFVRYTACQRTTPHCIEKVLKHMQYEACDAARTRSGSCSKKRSSEVLPGVKKFRDSLTHTLTPKKLSHYTKS